MQFAFGMLCFLDSDTCPDVGRPFPEVVEAGPRTRLRPLRCIQNKRLTS